MALLSLITIYINQIIPILQIIFGTFGNLLNILVFTRRSLRQNPCSTYFLALSINNLFVLYAALLTRLLASGWNIDPSQSNTILCKLRLFFAYSSLCLTQWFIVLASIDRFLSSCHTVRYRQLSNRSLAQKATIVLVLVTTIAHFHVLIWWSSQPVGSDYICNIFSDTYDLFFSIFYIIFTCLLPPFLMITFGLRTIYNIQKIRARVVPQNIHLRNVRLRSKDRQLFIMLLFQVLITIICNTPFTLTSIYSTINKNIEIGPDSISNNKIYYFLTDISRLLNYFNPVIGFYVYTLSSREFRNELKNVLKKRWLQNAVQQTV